MDNRLVLFLSKQCRVCERVLDLIEGIDDVDFRETWVMPARNGMYQVTNIATKPGELPILIGKKELPAVPALFDPVTKELVFAYDGIGQYLLDAGLLTLEDL